MRRLIVNADDFGLTDGVNRAVAELHRAGALSSATLMANGAALRDAVLRSKETPELAVGCHVVLVDGESCREGSGDNTLAKAGHLRDSLGRFLLDLQSRRIDEADIEAEAVAQISRLLAAGIQVTHVDTHKHTHLFPRVARPLMRAAQRCGIRAIRNPFEPAWSARYTRGALVRRLEVTLLRGFERSFFRLCNEHGLATTDGCIGVSATGNLDGANLASLLGELPDGTYELVCHPGYRDAALDRVHTRLRETREIERAALLAQIPAALAGGRIELLSFGGLAGSEASAP